MSKLAIAVLGHPKSGKSETWKLLFNDREIRTQKYERIFRFNENEYVMVFLINGSPQERNKPIDKIVGKIKPRIILCSLQYTPAVTDSIEYLEKNQHRIYCHWLNPGYQQPPYEDLPHIVRNLKANGATVLTKDGNGNLSARVEEIRNYLYQWAKQNDLILRES